VKPGGAPVFINIPGADSLATGELPYLPDGHWLRTVLPADECYQLGEKANIPALVLGAVNYTMDGQKAPKAFYFLDQVLDNTRTQRKIQRERAAEEAKKEREQKEREQRIREADPAYKQRQLEKRVAELEREAQGKDATSGSGPTG
jgi:hypothetical protein